MLQSRTIHFQYGHPHLVTPLGVLSLVAITIYGVTTLTSFVVIEMPERSNFLVIHPKPWLCNMDAIHYWSQKNMCIH